MDKYREISDVFKHLFQKDIDETLLRNIKINRQDLDKIKDKICFDGNKEKGVKVRTTIYNNIYKTFDKFDYENIKIWTSQNLYVLDKHCFNKIITNYKGQYKTYIKDQYKCGHFSIDFLDYMSDIAYYYDTKSSTSLGLLAFYYKINGKQYGHAVNWALINDNNNLNLLIIEPQTSEVTDFVTYFSERKRYKGYTDIKLELLLML